MGSRLLTTISAVVAALTTALLLPAAAPALMRAGSAADPFTLSAQAVDGPDQTDLYLTVDGNGAAAPTELGLVQVKVFAPDGTHVRTQNFHDVAAPAGKALLALADLEPRQVLEIKAHAKDGNQNNVDAKADVLQRPFGGVSSDVPEATDVGIEVLQSGGNAVDAAVAMQFALAVTQPQNAGLGGGSTAIVHLRGKGTFALDGRELSPADTTSTQYSGKTNANSSGFIVGVPGALKLAERMLQQWGTHSLAQSLAPAIALADDGFMVGRALDIATEPGRRCQNVGQPETKALYCTGAGLEQGTLFKQPTLANTFRLIAQQGTDVFYKGEIADAIVKATKRTRVPDGSGVGKMTLADLASYTLDDSTPLHIDYSGHELYTAGSSSRGGYIALQMLRMLELRHDDFPIGDAANGWGWLAPKTAHVIAEASALAFADHFYWMGGGSVPGNELLSDCYLSQRAALIKLDSRIVRIPRPVGDPLACTGQAFAADTPVDDYSSDGMTTHFSVVDKWGNAVAFTTTLTDAFGSGILVPEYGFALNDALSNFNFVPAAKPGAFPSPGDPGANDAGPNKRAGGYTTPLIAIRDGEVVLVTGSPGGFAIPSIVVNVVLNVLDHGLPLQDAVDRARIWFNLTQILWTSDVPAETLTDLRSRGHTVTVQPPTGGAHSVHVDRSNFLLTVARDNRIPDGAAKVAVN